MSSDYLVPRFCDQCGQALAEPVSAHGELAWICGACGHRHHRRPTAGVAVVVVESGQVLLVKRGHGDRAGFWCIPCGHVGWGEDVRQAARREVHEETGLVVEVDEILDAQTNLWRPQRVTVGMWFAGHRVGGTLRAGDDAVEAAFFPLDAPPELAFPTDESVLELVRARLGST